MKISNISSFDTFISIELISPVNITTGTKKKGEAGIL